mmetsp:Transcript_25000/g.57589  ORF Transcript_25000/g.57589 Transcript_25000/m.57589 type:complete len:224 (+) Transcript_25000:2168-2839(+)
MRTTCASVLLVSPSASLFAQRLPLHQVPQVLGVALEMLSARTLGAFLLPQTQHGPSLHSVPSHLLALKVFGCRRHHATMQPRRTNRALEASGVSGRTRYALLQVRLRLLAARGLAEADVDGGGYQHSRCRLSWRKTSPALTRPVATMPTVKPVTARRHVPPARSHSRGAPRVLRTMTMRMTNGGCSSARKSSWMLTSTPMTTTVLRSSIWMTLCSRLSRLTRQ